jgi:hypothetical protein
MTLPGSVIWWVVWVVLMLSFCNNQVLLDQLLGVQSRCGSIELIRQALSHQWLKRRQKRWTPPFISG